MSEKKKVEINYSKERVILSDILPFETPLIFSNRHFYRFLKTNGWLMNSNLALIKEVTKIKGNSKLKPLHKANLLKKYEVLKLIKKLMFCTSQKGLISKPLNYRILHKEDSFRELSIIHPKNQLEVVSFYDKYKDLILYYSKSSPYSIRKPHKLAKYVFFNDILHKKKKENTTNSASPEQYDLEYENLKSFFSIKKYNNIHKFYESYQFHRAEKKYNNLYKFDIAKCFDSIYTHSITWAILNKEIVKNNVNNVHFTFGGEFDFLMQKMNYNETNGIVIGPEISRVFAELILQQIDKNVHQALQSKK